jgi:uncharacterized protein YndB with AHSA1/START domain/DNA-binding transcriptional ArsR family regulator
MDLIFKALSDGTRRSFLDQLRKRDGQTVSELEAAASLSRFGVMKHLNILEAANLIVTRKAGRFKYHYLNAAPLQEVIDRWIEPLIQQPLTRAILDLKADIERNLTMTKNTKPDFVIETYIRATPEAIWEALTSADLSKRYYIAGASIHGAMLDNTDYQYLTPDGHPILTGKILSAVPPKYLEMTFQPSWMGPNAQASRISYELEHTGETTKLTILHFELPESQNGVKKGWAKITASLKSLLETGEALTFA